MKVNGINSTPMAGQTEQQKSPQKGQSKEAGASQSAVTHLSQAVQDTSKDINASRVAEIQEAIRNGELQVDADKIAAGLLQNVSELLGEDER